MAIINPIKIEATFTAADSPKIIDLTEGLGRDRAAKSLVIANKGEGRFTVEVAVIANNFSDIETLKKGGKTKIKDGSIRQIRLTHITDSSYKILASDLADVDFDDNESISNDPILEISRGNLDGVTPVNSFGRATNVDNNVNTDIWDRANAADDQDIWIAPTTARIHQIVSTSALDDGSPVGDGARTIEVIGLTDWDADEVTETITMNGTTNVPTVNAYVIIHRMRVLTKGATSVNVGVITATADTDATVTAQINAGIGRTQMAIFGVPSTQTAFLTNITASVNKTSSSGALADISVLINPEPDVELLNFIQEGVEGLMTSGTSNVQSSPKPYTSIQGPAIIKIQANGSANNLDVSASFGLILVDN